MAEAAAEYQVSRRQAMVCVDAPDRQAAVKAALDQHGFVMHPAKSAEEAIDRMRREPFDLVVVDDQYLGSSPLDNPVLAALRAMPMSIRRYMYVALLGREYKTFDNMMAFARSVNLVVNLRDLPHLAAILTRGLAEHAEFYRVYWSVLQEVGRR